MYIAKGISIGDLFEEERDILIRAVLGPFICLEHERFRVLTMRGLLYRLRPPAILGCLSELIELFPFLEFGHKTLQLSLGYELLQAKKTTLEDPRLSRPSMRSLFIYREETQRIPVLIYARHGDTMADLAADLWGDSLAQYAMFVTLDHMALRVLTRAKAVFADEISVCKFHIPRTVFHNAFEHDAPDDGFAKAAVEGCELRHPVLVKLEQCY
jgi:hypothetical protein